MFDSALMPYLKEAPMLLDLYIYLNYYSYLSSTYQKDFLIKYKELHTQFGSQSSLKHFKQSVKENVKKLVNINPNFLLQFNTDMKNGGIIVSKR